METPIALAEREPERILRSVSEALSSTLDLESILDALRKILVPAVCDSMSISIADREGELKTSVWYNANPDKERLHEVMNEKYYGRIEPLHSVFRSDVPIIRPYIDDKMLAEEAKSAEHFELLKALNFRSFICVPLKSRNRNLGVANFLQGDSGRRFAFSDLGFFKEIAYRVAMAIENSQLYEETKIQAEGFRALAETIPHQVWVGGPDGKLEYINRRYIRYTGLDPATVRKMSPGEIDRHLVHPDDVDRMHEETIAALKEKREFEVEIRCRRADGAYFWHNVHGVPVCNHEGAIERIFCTITDIHERKKIEFELLEAKEAAESASRAKSAFLVNVSHEIRTPLNSIIGYSELMRDGDVGPRERNEMLDVVIRNGKAVAQIIDDILDLSKIEAGKLKVEPKPVHVAELLHDVTAVFDIIARSKGITLGVRSSLPPNATVHTDPARLRQILINLVGNAVKFTSHGGVEIAVDFEVGSDPSSGLIAFRVKDTGIGIASADQESLFQPFVQADGSLTRKFGGTGLGLALSRRLARAMGGDVVLESSEKGRGSTFSCFLRATIESSGAGPRSGREPKPNDNGSLRGLRILIVEDSPDSQTLMKRILEKRGAIVETASNGEQGFEKAVGNGFDVVLMDIQMPVMNGYEATEKLRASGYEGPIVALTAHALAEEKQKCLSSGCSDYLTKPVDKAELFDVIQKQRKH